MNCERAQLYQRDSGRLQIKWNDPWRNSISSKTLANIKLNQMIHRKVQLTQKHHNKIQIKSNDMWKSLIKSKETMVMFK
jgi:hypothetical protein